jgi:hypothetical protein
MPVVPVQESPLKAFPVEPCNVVGLTGENSNVEAGSLPCLHNTDPDLYSCRKVHVNWWPDERNFPNTQNRHLTLDTTCNHLIECLCDHRIMSISLQKTQSRASHEHEPRNLSSFV